LLCLVQIQSHKSRSRIERNFRKLKKNKHKFRIVISQIENKMRYVEQRKKMDVIRNLQLQRILTMVHYTSWHLFGLIPPQRSQPPRSGSLLMLVITCRGWKHTLKWVPEKGSFSSTGPELSRHLPWGQKQVRAPNDGILETQDNAPSPQDKQLHGPTDCTRCMSSSAEHSETLQPAYSWNKLILTTGSSARKSVMWFHHELRNEKCIFLWPSFRRRCCTWLRPRHNHHPSYWLATSIA
jgi:hypothetical protein